MTYRESLENWQEARDLARQFRWDDDKSVRDFYEKQEIEAFKAIAPEVGVGCTIIYYTDRRAATVTQVLSPKKIVVKHNEVLCEDYYAGRYTILKEFAEYMGEDVFTKRKNGQWVMQGHPVKDGTKLVLHHQSHYIDPHF